MMDWEFIRTQGAVTHMIGVLAASRRQWDTLVLLFEIFFPSTWQ